jgi:phosphoglycerol transferase
MVRVVAVIFFATLLVVAYVTKVSPFVVSFIDGPELSGWAARSKWFTILSVASLIVTAMLLFRPVRAIRIYLFLLLPVSVIMSTYNVNAQLRNRTLTDAYDRAGLAAKSLIPRQDLGHVVILGEIPAATMRTLFYLDNAAAGQDLSYVMGDTYRAASLPAAKTWVVGIGNVRFDKTEFRVIKQNGFSIARRIEPMYPLHIDFGKAVESDYILGITGLSTPEGWGVWSVDKKLEFTFADNLPQRFTLKINASAFGPNVGKDFHLTVGGFKSTFQIFNDSTISIPVTLLGNVRSLTIEVPEPISPSELGLSQDARKLGIALKWLSINLDE